MKIKKKSWNNINNSQWDKDREQKIHQNRNKEQFQTVSSTLKAAIDEDGFLRERECEWRRQVLSRFKLSRWADSFNSDKSTNFAILTTGFYVRIKLHRAHMFKQVFAYMQKKKNATNVKKHTCMCARSLSVYLHKYVHPAHAHMQTHNRSLQQMCSVQAPSQLCCIRGPK